MKEEKERQGRKITPKTRLHEGKAFGICKKCGEKFRLKRKTKHKKGTYHNVICPKCGKKEMKKHENDSMQQSDATYYQ